MFLETGGDYYLLTLPNKKIKLTDGNYIVSPSFKIRYLTFSELSKIDNMSGTGITKLEINEQVFKISILDIIGFENRTKDIDIQETDAYIIDSIAEQVITQSYSLLNNRSGAFNYFANQVTWIEACARIVSYYTNHTSTEVMNWPVDKIIREYAICQAAFPNQIHPIEEPKQENSSKIG